MGPDLLGGLAEEMVGPVENLHVAAARDHLHHKRGVRGEDAVAVAVVQHERHVRSELAGGLAPRRLGGEGGDAGGVVEGPERFFSDVPESRRSIEKLAQLTFNTLLFGHGEPIEDRADTAVAALAASLT